MYYNDKVVWVSGASSGIGEALVYEFLRLGARVIATSNDLAELKRVQENCDNERCHIELVDMMKPEAFPSVVKDLYSMYERIDILINVAGVSQRSLFEDLDMAVFRRIFEINFFGTVALTREVLPCMLKQGGGQLAAVTSIVGLLGFPLRSGYSASKHALHGFFESIQAEYLSRNIHVTLLVPGRVKTDISKNALTANGSLWGKIDDGQASGISVEKTARKISAALKRRKKLVLIGGRELSIVYIKKYVPALFWRVVSKIKPT